ncbi:MAG: hypothetical protein AUI15_00510 [Actinobacteria bacterium 13_2_20CM_2_66_6]|nr:MAG: hypothetical protein AUI15_00510 [Actinobacteria bacterium 13_2_20CM_2_66_6]
MPVTTVGEAVTSLEQSLLIAREAELEIFRNWLLDSGSLEVLNLSGPPGVGKTTLLQAFAREAEKLGRRIAAVDGHSFGATPLSLVTALSADHSSDIQELITELNREHSVVLLDTFEELEHLTGFLQQQLLPYLNTSVRIVIAGRRPLVLSWHRADGWPKIVRLLPVEGFSVTESHSYLARRGLGDKLIDQVVTATGGNPLALSLAADIVLQFGVRDFAASSHWRLAARSLVSRLLSEAAPDPALVSALEACSVVRVFDEATLSAITHEPDVDAAFDRLCHLSVIKPCPHGLMLHDYVRAIIAQDLLWRRPLHHQTLRRRALDHFRERLRTSSAEDRTWLIAEWFFLWSNALIQETFFGSDGVDNVNVDPGVDVDAAQLRDLYLAEMVGIASDEDVRLLGDVLTYPGTRLRVAREKDGRPMGFSTVVPVCTESIGILERHPVHGKLLERFYVNARRETLPKTADAATAQYLLHVVAASDPGGAVRRPLLRDLAGIFGLGGTYLCTTRDALFDQLMEVCGFEALTSSEEGGDDRPATGWVLDLTRRGFEGWIESIIEGRPTRAVPNPVRLESELQGALVHWNDPDWLATNCSILASAAPIGERPNIVRRAIEEALSRVRTEGSMGTEQACRALELAYMKKRANHKEAMCSLAVSRATFYRLCKRGIHTLAGELLTSWRSASPAG